MPRKQKLAHGLLIAALLFVGAAPTRAQIAPRRVRASGDAQIKSLLAEIDARNIRRTVLKLASFGTRNTLSSQDDKARGIGAARDWLFEEFSKLKPAANGHLTVELQSFEQPVAARIPQPTKITNVVATLRGTQAASADRVYVVSGHYDSMCASPVDAQCDAPGANDDASGVAAVLEMARVMSRREFEATIVFLAVAGEEQGLLGARYFAEQAKAKKMNIAGMFTNDIVGNSLDERGRRDRGAVRVFAEGVPSNETDQEAVLRRSVGGENDSASRQLARFVEEIGAQYVPATRVQVIYRRDRYGRGGDHIPFLEQGYPALRFTEPNEIYAHQHQNVRREGGVVFGDLPEFVDDVYVAQVARVNAAALAALALAPAAPHNVRVLTKRLTNDTDLQWQAGTEPDLSHYEIVWRETTAPTWTHSRRVGRVTSYTVPNLSKDNFFFGVRTVDMSGHRSVVSYPRPLR